MRNVTVRERTAVARNLHVVLLIDVILLHVPARPVKGPDTTSEREAWLLPELARAEQLAGPKTTGVRVRVQIPRRECAPSTPRRDFAMPYRLVM